MGAKIYSPACEAFVKGFEKLSLVSYHGKADRPEVWTIGWGHTADVKEEMTITLDHAEELFTSDLTEACLAVLRWVQLPLTQGQLDALTSFVFNDGEDAFKRSTMLRCINGGNWGMASAEFPKWCHANGVPIPGLLRRRMAEKTMFDGIVL